MRDFVRAFGAAVLGALLVVVLQRAMTAEPTFVAVDVQRLLAGHIAELGARQMDTETQKREATAYAGALEAALDDIANRDNTIVLVGPAVLRGVPDVTEAVQASIVQRLHLPANKQQEPAP
jgi:type-F conjugative transfer system protein TrbI